MPSGFDPEFTVPSLPRRTFRAVIFYMSTVADPTTHMFECKARSTPTTPRISHAQARLHGPHPLPVREHRRGRRRAGGSRFGATERGFLVFEVVKKTGKDGSVEWVAKSKKVDVGARAPGWVEIRTGISPGQWIVQRGAEALDDGVPVKIPDEQLKLLK